MKLSLFMKNERKIYVFPVHALIAKLFLELQFCKCYIVSLQKTRGL